MSYLDDKYRCLEGFAVEIAKVVAPNMPQRTPERLADLCVETAKQIIDRCDEIKRTQPLHNDLRDVFLRDDDLIVLDDWEVDDDQKQ